MFTSLSIPNRSCECHCAVHSHPHTASQNNPFVLRVLLLIVDLITNRRILFVNNDLWSLVLLETVSSSIFHFPLLPVSLPNGSPLPVGRSNLVPSSISSPILTDIEQNPQLHLLPLLHNIGCGWVDVVISDPSSSFTINLPRHDLFRFYFVLIYWQAWV